MFAPVIQFVPPYRTPWDGPPGIYNPELVTPPRIYGEAFADRGPWAMLTNRGSGTGADASITLLAYFAMTYYPSWEIMLMAFDATTGEFKSRAPVPWGPVEAAFTGDVVQGFDGSVWRTYLQDIQELTADLTTVLQTVTHTHFGITQCQQPTVDKLNDFVVMADESGQHSITVYTLSTGAVRRQINVSDAPICIAPEQGARVYVLGTHGLLNLVDTATGLILGTWKCPTSPGTIKTLVSWDEVYHRLLVLNWTPDATDGACTSTITGFHPLPIPTQIQAPVPLATPRKGRTVNIMTRLTGDAGESIAGQLAVSGSATGQGNFTGYSRSQVQDAGYARLPFACTDQGSAELTVSVTV